MGTSRSGCTGADAIPAGPGAGAGGCFGCNSARGDGDHDTRSMFHATPAGGSPSNGGETSHCGQGCSGKIFGRLQNGDHEGRI